MNSNVECYLTAVAMSERLKERIAALRLQYVATFTDEIAGFEASFANAENGGVKAGAQRAHRIAGTSGSYELTDVCTAAQEVERLYEEGRADEALDAAKVLCQRLAEAQATAG